MDPRKRPEKRCQAKENAVRDEGEGKKLDLTFTRRAERYISGSHVTLSDRYCHSMKWLCCRDFVCVQLLTGECRQWLASLICYHLHVEHTHGSLMLTWNTGSAMCHSFKVQSAKVTLRANTHRCTQSHTHTHILIPREPLSSSVLFHVFILGLLMRRVVSGILSGPSDLSAVVQPLSPFWSTGKGLNCWLLLA